MAKKINKTSSKAPAKKLKKYNLAGYNMSSLSQAPQASYYLGKSAAEAAGSSMDPTLDMMRRTTDQQQMMQEEQDARDKQMLLNTTQSLGNQVAGLGRQFIQNRAALKAAEEASKAAAGKTLGQTSLAMLDEAGTVLPGGNVAGEAAKTAFSGIGSAALPSLATAVQLAGMGIKMSGNDKDAATFGDKEERRYKAGTIVNNIGQFAGYGSAFGPLGTAIGAGIGAGVGIVQAKKGAEKMEEQANELSRMYNNQATAAQQAFINSRLMDVNRGGSQMARYGGIKYEMGGPGDPENPYIVTGIDPKADYERAMNQYKVDYMKARYADIESANPRTLQDRIPYPTMPMTERQQRRVEQGKNPSTFFKYYPEDPSFAGTRDLNTWSNQAMENAGLSGFETKFRKEIPSPEEMAMEESSGGKLRFSSGSGGGKGYQPHKFDDKKIGFFKNLFMDAQEKDCRGKGRCGSKATGGYKYATGGVRRVEGGVIKPIPNSNDVEFIGRSHEDGGIKLDKYTEVEGGETATTINGKEYYFSEFLKKNGKSYSQLHKEITASNLPQSKKTALIKELAKDQESRAGRDPKTIKATGGYKYAEGGLGCPDGYVNDPVYGCIPEYLAGAEAGPTYKTDREIARQNFASDPYNFGVKPDIVYTKNGPMAIGYNYENTDLVNPAIVDAEDPRYKEFDPMDLIGAASITDKDVKEYLKDAGFRYNTKTKKYASITEDGKVSPLSKQEQSQLFNNVKETIADAYNSKVAGNYTEMQRLAPKEPALLKLDSKPLDLKMMGYPLQGATAENGKDCPPGYYPDLKGNCIKAPENLDLTDRRIPGLAEGLVQLAPVLYAAANPFERVKAIASPQGIAAPKLGRVNADREIEDSRRNFNGVRKFIENSNIGPGKFALLSNLATKSAKEAGAIAEATNRQNTELRGKEAQLAASISQNNQNAALEAARANATIQLQQNTYEDERRLAIVDALATRLAGIGKDVRNYKLQKDIARSLDETGAFSRNEMMDQLRILAKKKGSPVYGMNEAELRGIASVYGENYGLSGIVIKDDKKEKDSEKKKLGGMKRSYTSRLGELTSAKKTLAKN
jgi:hypothetical protein